MKNIFIAVLIVAGTLYACTPGNTSDRISAKGLIIGEWAMDSLDFSKTTDSSLDLLALLYISEDSNYRNIRFTFHANGLITEYSDDGETDSSHYEWEGEKTLLFRSADSTREKWAIQHLDSARLVIMAEDSVTFYFNKTKQN